VKRSLSVLLCIVVLVLLSGVASAQSGVRFVEGFSPYDDFEDIALAFTHVPSQNTENNIQQNTTEIGERVHDCREDVGGNPLPGVGTHSVWLKLHFPGGTLTLDSAPSSYDTIISVYTPAGTFADLISVACNDEDDIDVSNQARVVAALPAGMYFVQISRWQSTPTASVLTLGLNISATFSGAAPANDNFAAAQEVTLGKAIVTTNVEFATEQANEPPHSCVGPDIPSRSVWYKFVPGPRFARLNITTDGSRLDSAGSVISDTVVEAFDGPDLAGLDSLGCNDTVSNAGMLTDIEAFYNTTVYIRVTEFTSGGLSGPSSYRIKVTASFYGGFGANTSFQDPLGSEWKLKNFDGFDGRFCFPGVAFGIGDDCTFQFTGGAGERTKLSQTVTLPANLKPPKGSQIYGAFAMYSLSPLADFKATLKVSYTDGTPPSKHSIKLIGSPGPDYALFSLVVELTSKNVGSAKLQFVNKSAGGQVRVDGTAVLYRGGFARSAPDGALPLPPVTPG
jgi:hypothetical protein